MALLGQDQERPSGETAWTVLDAANDLGDIITIDACRRVIDADLRGETPARSDVAVLTRVLRLVAGQTAGNLAQAVDQAINFSSPPRGSGAFRRPPIALGFRKPVAGLTWLNGPPRRPPIVLTSAFPRLAASRLGGAPEDSVAGRRLSDMGWERMRVELALPPSKRDLRLDLFRGLANWLMFLGHVSTSVLAWFSFRNYGFSDGADLFVFISGYTSALVFGRRMLEGGFVFGTTRLLRRVWQIYAAHILLFVFYLASVHFLASQLQRARSHRPVQCRARC